MLPVSLMTSQLVIAGTNSVGKRTLRCRPAQSCASVITGVTPGGLTRRDAAKDGGLMMIAAVFAFVVLRRPGEPEPIDSDDLVADVAPTERPRAA